MSYEAEAVTALKEAARAVYRATFEAGSRFARSHSDTQQATDIVDVLSRTIDLLVACEALHDAADAGVRDLRARLSTTMNDTGATRIEAAHFTAHLQRKPAFVSIDQEDLIPTEFIVQKPSLDKRAIAAAIKDGTQVPGASLLTPNEPVLVLRARKEAA